VLRDVTEVDTATSVGSGDVPVLATPRLIAWLEAATVQAASQFIRPGPTTVGTAVRFEHRRATRVAGTVEVSPSRHLAAAGRLLTFLVRAIDDSGQLFAAGEIDRAIVDRDRSSRLSDSAKLNLRN
jgi:fluoroacetyl-CoA thioesterase